MGEKNAHTLSYCGFKLLKYVDICASLVLLNYHLVDISRNLQNCRALSNSWSQWPSLINGANSAFSVSSLPINLVYSLKFLVSPTWIAPE